MFWVYIMYILQFQIDQFGLLFLCVENCTAQQYWVLTVFQNWVLPTQAV